MRAIGVSPVYLHLLAWLTTDHRGKKPADMAGQQPRGRLCPKMQTSHLDSRVPRRHWALNFNISNIFGWQAEESLLGGWRWLSGKLKRTMMNWSGSVCFYFPLTYQDLTSLSWQNSNLNRGVYKWRIQRWSRIIFSVALELSWIYLNKHSLWILMPNFWESLALCPLNLVALQWLG